jgi:type VI secretion system ImpA family protein
MKTLPTDFRFDIDKLLSPISSDNPAGVSLRYDAVYDKLRDLRKADDASLPQGVWKADLKRADWPGVEALCLETLETRSKDLQIAAWLVEAWIHLHGFAGAAEGFRVLLALCESFWEGMHPRIEGQDVEFRIAPLIWANRKLSVDLKMVPITAPESDDVAQYTWSDWEFACQSERQGKSDMARAVTIAKFQQSVMLTATLDLHASLEALDRLLGVCEKLEILLDERLKRDAPGLVAVRSTAESIAGLLTSALGQRGGLAEAPSSFDHGSPGAHPEESENGTGAFEFNRIRTRAEAYQLLAEAADFLSRTEPHSPTPYLIRRAVAWGAMPFDKLLTELVSNRGELVEISRLLNLRDAHVSEK